MADFLAIRNRHLRVFEQYQQRKRQIFRPVLRANAKINSIKRLALAVDRTVRGRHNLLPAEMIGRRVNILI
jgi:hypothetical protein